MKLKVGVVGCGRFSTQFVSLFRDHPLVEKVAVCDMVRERANRFSQDYGIKDVYYNYEDMLKSDINCVAVFTQRDNHAPFVLAALDAGKHVCEAVPIANSLEDIAAIVEKVKTTGLTYMTMETSYYYASTIFCRRKFQEGSMGTFVYGEARYCHNIQHMYNSFQSSGGENWKQKAGFPPMYYPTHSTSMILSVTNSKVKKVSCSGFEDRHEDEIFAPGGNLWNNPFSNQTALMYTADGGSFIVNEFRRTGYTNQKNAVYLSMFGTDGVYEQGATGCAWMELHNDVCEDVTELLNCSSNRGYNQPIKEAHLDESIKQDFVTTQSAVQNIARLPKEFIGHNNGHFGSHQFLVDDFVKAAATDKLPPNHVWAAADYCAPGLVAHESSTKGGLLLAVPDFGCPPAGKAFLEPDA